MGIKVRVGDLVQVMRGSRNRNPEKPPTRGKVLSVDREKGLVWVEGHNLRIRHLKKSPKHPQGGRLRREAPVRLTNVMLVTDGGRPVRLSKAARQDDGKVVGRGGASETKATGRKRAAAPSSEE